MKKILLPLIILALPVISFAQLFQATIKPGTAANKVIIAIKPDAAFTGTLTGVVFTLQIDNSVSPMPTLHTRSLLTPNFSDAFEQRVADDGTRTNFYLANSYAGTATTTLAAGEELNVLEVTFLGGPTEPDNEVRLAHLPAGGPGSFYQLYVESTTGDMTNYNDMFYGTGDTQGSTVDGYNAYNFVPLQDVALPIKWLGSNVIKQNNDALITWSTGNEIMNSHFEIERSSDGKNFKSIGTVKSFGSGNPVNTYSFTDKDVIGLKKSVLQYRIRQFDVDGKSTSSKIHSLRFDSKSVLLHLFPNPANSRATITLDLPFSDKVLISIIDSRGRIVSTQHINFVKGINQHTLEVFSLSKGSYDVTLKSDNISESLKLIRQ